MRNVAKKQQNMRNVAKKALNSGNELINSA